jgi:hypothetical protein
MTINVPQINTAADTFGSWVSRTNQIAGIISNNAVTVDSTANGSLSTGNGFVNGYFGATTITTSFLKGGNVQSNIDSITAISTINQQYQNTLSSAANSQAVVFTHTVPSLLGNAIFTVAGVRTTGNTTAANGSSFILQYNTSASNTNDISQITFGAGVLQFIANNNTLFTVNNSVLVANVNVTASQGINLNSSNVTSGNVITGIVLNSNTLNSNTITSNNINSGNISFTTANGTTLKANSINTNTVSSNVLIGNNATIANSLIVTGNNGITTPTISTVNSIANTTVSNTVVTNYIISNNNNFYIFGGNTTLNTQVIQLAVANLTYSALYANVGGIVISQANAYIGTNGAVIDKVYILNADIIYANTIVTNAEFITVQIACNTIYTTNAIACNSTIFAANNITTNQNVYAHAFVPTSDARIKTNINVIDPATAKIFIKQIQPKTFTYISDGSSGAGYIAQDLLGANYNSFVSIQMSPGVPAFSNIFNGQMINSPADNIYGVNYQMAIPYIHAAVEDLYTQVDYINNKLNDIQNRLVNVESLIDVVSDLTNQIKILQNKVSSLGV